VAANTYSDSVTRYLILGSTTGVIDIVGGLCVGNIFANSEESKMALTKLSDAQEKTIL
jgi:hypothetical protein